jgi:hypothetical protein
MPNGLPSKKKPSAKILAFCLSAFVILLFLSMLCLPMLFSTTLGKNMLIKMISNRTGFQLEIEELSLSWFGSQWAKGIQAQKPEEQLNLSAQEIQTDASLWKLAFMNDLGQMQITAPDLQISKPFQPTAYVLKKPLQGASFAAHAGVEVGMPIFELPMRGKIIVKDGKAAFTSPGLDPIAFDHIALSLDMASKEEVALALSCTTSLQGQIALKGAASHLKDPFPHLAIQSTIHQLPVRGIDQLISVLAPDLNGLIYSFLGPTIDLECNLSADEGNFDLHLNALSPQMTAHIDAQTSGGVLSLKYPAEFNVDITPLLLQKMAKLYPALGHFALEEPVLFQTTIAQFSCPVPSYANDLLKSSFQAELVTPPEICLMLNGQPLLLNNLHVKASSPSLQEQISVSLSGSVQSHDHVGSIAIEGNASMPFRGVMQGTLSLDAEQFPLDLVGVFVSGSNSLSDLLGPVADLHAKADFEENNQKLHVTWQSDFLKIPAFDLSLGNTWTLISPSQFTLTLNPKWINPLLPQGQLQLVKAVPFQGTLQNLSIPIQNIKNTQVDVNLNAGQMTWSGTFPLQITKMQALLAMNTFNQITLQVDGDPVQASLAASYDPVKAAFTFTKPLSVRYTLDNPLLKAIIPTAPQLAKPVPVLLSVDPFILPISGEDPTKLKIKGQLSSVEMVLGPPGKQVALQNTSVPFQWDGAGKTASVQLSSQVENPSGGSGNMQGQFNLSHFSTEKGWDLSTVAIQGSLDLQNLSSSLLDTFSGKCLSAITGPTFSSKFKLQSAPDKQNIVMKWISPNLNIDAAFAMDNSCLQLQGASNQMTWILTPDGYQALDQLLARQTSGLIPFEIKEASTFTIALSKLSLPMIPRQKVGSLCDRFPDMSLDLTKLQLHATGHNPKLTFFDKSSRDTIQLSNLTFSLDKSGQNPLAIAMDSTVVTQGSSAANAKNGSISLSGRLEQTMNPQGGFDFSQLTGGLQFKAQQLPSRALDLIARAKGRTDFPFTTVFGNMINATLNIDLKQFSGPFSLNINTPLTRADLNGTIKNGALMLNDAIHVQMKITPEISRLVLKEVNPLNLSYVYSEEPVTLVIPPSGFFFPLYPFQLSRITIPEATIELGKMTCRNEGNVHTTLGLLKSKQFDKSKDLTLWFAPIDLSIKQGSADIERTEILLADTFDICLWGQVDLVKDYIDMVLGLTAQTLSKAFGIKNLPENYVLTIPMRGKADDVQIDTSKATTKVTLLLAWQQASSAGAFGKGPAGAIVGGLLNKMATLPDSNAKVPPAKHPFPWEVGKTKTSHEPNEKKRQYKLDEKPLKQILKLIK